MRRERILVAAGLLALAAVVAIIEHWPAAVVPVGPPSEITLRGKFVGASASDDAAALSGMCAALADALEVDGKAAAPRITTGLQMEDLRVAACEFRFQTPLRDRQPHVRAAVGRYMDQFAGTSGGPLTSEGRAKWVTAFREVSAAAMEAIQ